MAFVSIHETELFCEKKTVISAVILFQWLDNDKEGFLFIFSQNVRISLYFQLSSVILRSMIKWGRHLRWRKENFKTKLNPSETLI